MVINVRYRLMRSISQGLTHRLSPNKCSRPVCRTISSMSEEQKYLFDLNGYIIVRNVLSTEEVAVANNVIDKREKEALDRSEAALRNTKQGTFLSGDGKSPRLDLGGILEWGDDSKIFRSLLAHPKLIPYLHTLVGPGYRLDHMPFCILQEKGSEGFHLHGGMIDCMSGDFNYYLSYQCINDQISNSLLGCSVALVDHNPGDGGFCIVRGSHKSNFRAPRDMIHGDAHRELLVETCLKAGDVVLFSEATVHGALPWQADRQRRLALYRFAPPTMAYGRSYATTPPAWPSLITDEMTEAELAVLTPPYNTRLDRPLLQVEDSGEVSVSSQSRTPAKKIFDKKVFKTDYF